MYVRKIPVKKSGRIMLAYFVAKRENGKNKHVFVEKIGFLDELQQQFADPLVHFRQEAKKRTAQEKLASSYVAEHFIFDASSASSAGGVMPTVDLCANYGFLALSRLYHELEIDYFLNNRRRYTHASFNHNVIFQLLVYGRILFPDSKLGTWQNRGRLMANGDFSDDDVYRALPFFSRFKEDLLAHLDSRVRAVVGRNTALMYYDVTNYYWEIDHEDDLRRYGCSKEHRPEPIVQMGLAMDGDGLPVTYGLFPGNTSDVSTFIPAMKKIQEGMGAQGMVYVADKGMMSGMNVAELIMGHNGYVISSSVRKADALTRAFILEEEGYCSEDDGQFKFKSRLVPVERWVVEQASGRRRKVAINERQIVFWSRKYAKKASVERHTSIAKALGRATGGENTVLNNHAGNRFLSKSIFDAQDGRKVEEAEFSYELDEQLLASEEEMDGYYMICTNVVGTQQEEKPWKGESRFRSDNLFELNRSVTDKDIIGMYRGLWQIEDCFRLTKSWLKARPVYVRTPESIDAHFLSCFVALLLVRILEKRTDRQIPAPRIVESLRKANLCLLEDGSYLSTYCDPVIAAIGRALDIDMTKKKYGKTELKSIIAATKKT